MKQAEEATRREAALRLGSRDSSEGESLPHHFAAVVLPWRYPVWPWPRLIGNSFLRFY